MLDSSRSVRFTTLAISILAACTEHTEITQGRLELAPSQDAATNASAATEDGHTEPDLDTTCAEGEYPWQDSDGAMVCGEPAASTGTSPDDYEPGMPDPAQVPDLECETKTLFTATTACVPQKPTLYRSVLRLYKFDIVKGVKIGEHSTSKVTRYRWDWDPAVQAYKGPVVDAETMHSNHWSKTDARLAIYGRVLETPRTDIKGVGFTTYPATANTHCPCADDVGHLTKWDSCYVLTVSPIFKHVCHSDTRVQVRSFQTAAGLSVTLGDVCGQGLADRNAPVP